MKVCKYIFLIFIILFIKFQFNFIYALPDLNEIIEKNNDEDKSLISDTVDDALNKMSTSEIDRYMKENNDYFKFKDFDIKELVKKAINGELKVNIIDYIKYQIAKEKNFIKRILVTSVNILIISVILTILNYFTEDKSKESVSKLVVFFSILIVFILATKDINYIKCLLKREYIKFSEITYNINGMFLGVIVTIGKLGIIQFFQQYSNYIIGMTTNIIYYVTEIMTIILTVIILINNISKLIDAKLLYKFLKKATLFIFAAYIFIVVINFSVQGYILYKTDNIFISSIKSLSPSSAPVVGNAVNNFFGLFMNSLMLIKDFLGFIIILFIYSTFGSSIIRLIIITLMYKLTAAICEPFNSSISKLLQELSDIMYIYFACLMTPIIIITIYYSILIKYINNIFM